MFWLILMCVLLCVIILTLIVKILLLQKAVREIRAQFSEKLQSDTNTLITLSTGDRTMRALADAINTELRELRRQKHKFVAGDAELKNAVTNISHDLRTPLTAISSYLELLDRAEKSETVARYLEVIENRTKTLIDLTEELFRYSVITSPEYDAPASQVEVNAVLEESILGFYAAFQERGITPDIDLPEKKIVRMLNPDALSRVFSNVLSNALKYSAGDLRIVMKEDGEIWFSNRAPELSGVQLEKLFDRFYTLESARKSTGLGLSIARTLLEHMGGEISAVYEDERLSIRIRLPETE